MPRSSMFMMLMLAGALLPYVISNQSVLRDAVTSPFKSDASEQPKAAATGSLHGAAPAGFAVNGGQSQAAQSAAGKPAVPASMISQSRSSPAEPFVPLEQALRWEITPAWILAQWPRVTTHLAELETQGYRVTLVTGTAQTDLAGALTYYFDATQRLRKIVFHGTTGDAKRLVQFALGHHRFERRLTNDPSVYLYQVEHDGKALSELRIKTAPVVRSSSAYSRFEVALTMNRPKE